jgi:hypothetical protein
VLGGDDLNNVQSITMDGQSLSFTATSTSELSLALPSHSAGFVSLNMSGKGLRFIYANAVEYVTPVVAAVTGAVTKSGTLTTSGLQAVQAAISRGRQYPNISISYSSTPSKNNPVAGIKLKDNIALMKLATRLSLIYGRTISIAVKPTGNISQIEVTFTN